MKYMFGSYANQQPHVGLLPKLILNKDELFTTVPGICIHMRTHILLKLRKMEFTQFL